MIDFTENLFLKDPIDFYIFLHAIIWFKKLYTSHSGIIELPDLKRLHKQTKKNTMLFN